MFLRFVGKAAKPKRQGAGELTSLALCRVRLLREWGLPGSRNEGHRPGMARRAFQFGGWFVTRAAP